MKTIPNLQKKKKEKKTKVEGKKRQNHRLVFTFTIKLKIKNVWVVGAVTARCEACISVVWLR